MCKSAHYGNCDVDTENEEYCIFHKPNKTKEEAKIFYEKLIEVYEPEMEETYTEGYGYHKRYIFEGHPVDFRGFVFPEIPEDCEFTFLQIEFKGDVIFDDVVFEFAPNFEMAEFDFVSFNDVIFKKGVYFTSVEFNGGAWFIGTKFNDHSLFNLITFSKPIFMRFVEFDTFYFSHIKFKHPIAFENLTGNSIGFFNCGFEDIVVFVIDAVKKIELVDVKFKSFTSFLPGNGDGAEKIDFFNVNFNKVFFEPIIEKIKDPFSKAEACRIQKISYEKEGRKDMAEVMYLKEKRYLRKAKIQSLKSPKKSERKDGLLKNGLKRLGILSSVAIETLLADFTCEYGTNWKRPVYLWLFFVLLAFPILYWVLGGVVGATSPLDNWYFSVVTATTLGYGDMHPVGYAKILSSIEAVFGMFMWAIFLTVFARKYMK